VEIALTLPILVYGLIGGADLARAYAAQVAVQNAARAGAEAAAIDYTPTSGESVTAAKNELGNTPGVNPNSATITVTFTQSDGTTACLQSPSIATPCYANVRVQYTYTTIGRYPGMPSTFKLDRITKMRRFI